VSLSHAGNETDHQEFDWGMAAIFTLRAAGPVVDQGLGL